MAFSSWEGFNEVLVLVVGFALGFSVAGLRFANRNAKPS